MTLVLNSLQIEQNITGARATVRVATTTNGALATAYENADTIDDVVLATGDRILLKNQSTSTENGVYIVEATGAPTRADDLATGDSANGVFVWVKEGTANANTGYICTSAAGSDVVGTNNLIFSQFDVVNTLAASRGGTGVTTFGGTNTILYTSATDTLTSITTANNSVLVTNGSGVPSVSTTLPSGLSATNTTLTTPTISGDIVFDEATNDLTLAVTDQATGVATVSIPDIGGVSGDMVITNATQTLSNKTLTLPQINDTSADHQYIFAVSELIADRTVTLPLLTGNDTFVFEGHTQTLTNKTLTSPAIGTSILDTNGNELFLLTATASAVNELTYANAAIGTNPSFASSGTDTNIGLDLVTKGTGTVNVSSVSATDSGIIRLLDNTGGQYGAWSVPDAVTTSYTLQMPDGVGTANQVLSTDGNNPAQLSWATVATARYNFQLSYNQISATPTSATAVSWFAWDDSEYGAFTGGSLTFWYENVDDRDLVVTLRNVTEANNVVTTTISNPAADGILQVSLTTLPTADATLELRVNKSAGGGTNPLIKGVQLALT